MLPRRTIATIAVILLMIVWGSTFLVTKESAREIPPLTLGFLRFVIAALTLGTISIARPRRPRLPQPFPLGPLLLMAFAGVAVFSVGFNYALIWGSVTQGSIIYALAPAAVALAAFVILKEKIPRRRLTGIILSILGVAAVVATGGKAADAPRPILAAIAMLLVITGWAVYTVVAKRLANADQVAVMTWVTAMGAAMLMPFATWETLRNGMPHATPAGWAGVIFLGIIASALAYIVFNQALRELDASVVGALGNLDPVVGVLSAVLFLGESLNGWQIAGGVAALGGMWLASMQEGRERLRHKK
jgi:RarD protein